MGACLSLKPPVGSVLRKIRALPLVARSGLFFRWLQGFWSEAVTRIQATASADSLVVLAMATCFLCDTACSTALEVLTERFIAPVWQRLRDSRRARSANLPGRVRSLRQLLSSSSRCEKNSRPFRSVHISHNPPPPVPSLSPHCI